MTVVRFVIAGSDGESFFSRLSRVGRVFIRQQPSGDAKVYGPMIDGLVDPLKVFEFPYGPKEVTYEGSALDFQEIQRPGLKPILKSIAPKLRRIALSAALADRSSFGVDSIEDQIALLEDIAQDDLDLSFVHGGVHLGYLVRLTSMTITSLERTLNGEITRAMLDLNFQESSPLNIDVTSLSAITTEPTTPDEVSGDPDGDPPEMLSTGSNVAGGAGEGVDLTPPSSLGPGLDQLLS